VGVWGQQGGKKLKWCAGEGIENKKRTMKEGFWRTGKLRGQSGTARVPNILRSRRRESKKRPGRKRGRGHVVKTKY